MSESCVMMMLAVASWMKGCHGERGGYERAEDCRLARKELVRKLKGR
jgi:hypothetical protein